MQKTFVVAGADPFGFPTLIRPWDDGTDSILNAERRMRIAFDFMSKLGVKVFYWQGELLCTGDGSRSYRNVCEKKAKCIN